MRALIAIKRSLALGLGSKFAFLFLLSCRVAWAGDLPSSNSDVAPSPAPQSVQDIVTLLSAEKPDQTKRDELTKKASAEIPNQLKGSLRAEAVFRRAEARVQVGRLLEGIADTKEAIKVTLTQGKPTDIKANYGRVLSRFEQYLQRRSRLIGDYATAIPIMQKQAHNFQPRGRGRLPSIYAELYFSYRAFGDVDRANQYLRLLRGIVAESNGWSVPSSQHDTFRTALSEAQGNDQELRGQFDLAEETYRKGLITAQSALDTFASQTDEKFFPYREDFESNVDRFKLSVCPKTS